MLWPNTTDITTSEIAFGKVKMTKLSLKLHYHPP